jgi:hypothetical protein
MPTFNAAALSALVDKWRPETHSFHLPCGEMTITLQDVSMVLALPIRGHAVTGSTSSIGWRERVQELLGIAPDPPTPPAKDSKTSGVSLKWLEDNFQDLDDDAGEVDVVRHAVRMSCTCLELSYFLTQRVTQLHGCSYPSYETLPRLVHTGMHPLVFMM